MNARLAHIISVVFHPLLMATWLLVVFGFVAPASIGIGSLGFEPKIYILGFLFMTTFVIPSLATYYLYKFGVVKNLQLYDRQERRIPYFFTVLAYAVATYFFNSATNPVAQIAPHIGTMLFGITTSIIAVALITLWWKISAHAVGVGGAVGIVSVVYILANDDSLLIPLLFLFLSAGTILSARLALKAHTTAQVYVGFAVGVLVNILVFTVIN